MTAEHATFVIDRTLAASVERVFAAWANPEKKRRWFACHADWRTVAYELDFRVGGSERNVVVPPDGVPHVMSAHYFDIVPGERIVYAYDMHVGDARISVSLVTVEFAARAGKTRMTFTEQVVILDGLGDVADRRAGTELGLARLDGELV